MQARQRAIESIRAVTDGDFPYHRTTHFGELDGSLHLVPEPVGTLVQVLAVGRAGQSVQWLAENMSGWIWHRSDLSRLGEVVES